jgi:hypothetical protein
LGDFGRYIGRRGQKPPFSLRRIQVWTGQEDILALLRGGLKVERTKERKEGCDMDDSGVI